MIVFLLLSYSQKALFIPAHVIKTMAVIDFFALHSSTLYALGKYEQNTNEKNGEKLLLII